MVGLTVSVGRDQHLRSPLALEVAEHQTLSLRLSSVSIQSPVRIPVGPEAQPYQLITAAKQNCRSFGTQPDTRKMSCNHRSLPNAGNAAWLIPADRDGRPYHISERSVPHPC